MKKVTISISLFVMILCSSSMTKAGITDVYIEPGVPSTLDDITIFVIDEVGTWIKVTVLFTIDTSVDITTITTTITTTQETSMPTTTETTTTTAEIGSYPGIISILIFVVTLVVAIRRSKKT